MTTKHTGPWDLVESSTSIWSNLSIFASVSKTSLCLIYCLKMTQRLLSLPAPFWIATSNGGGPKGHRLQGICHLGSRKETMGEHLGPPVSNTLIQNNAWFDVFWTWQFWTWQQQRKTCFFPFSSCGDLLGGRELASAPGLSKGFSLRRLRTLRSENVAMSAKDVRLWKWQALEDTRRYKRFP